MSTTQVVTCEQAACNAAKGGECLEGSDISSCKFAQVEEIEDEVQQAVTQPEIVQERAGFRHLSGDDLDLGDVNRVLRSGLTRVVVVAGPPGSKDGAIVINIRGVQQGTVRKLPLCLV